MKEAQKVLCEVYALGTAEEKDVNEVLGEGWGDEGVPCKTDDRDGPGDDVLKYKGGSEGGSKLPTIEPLLLFEIKYSQLLPLDLDKWHSSRTCTGSA